MIPSPAAANTAATTVHTLRPVDLGLTLGPLVHGGRWDPTVRVTNGEVWRAFDTDAGPATVHLRSQAPNTIAARAWGPGADAALAAVPDLVGAFDDPPSLAGHHPLVTDLERRLPGLRVGHTGAVFDALVPTVLGQRVIGKEAGASYRAMVRASGRRAPLPVGPGRAPGFVPMLLPPTPEWLRHTPYWAFHRWGVEQKRATTITTAAAHASVLATLQHASVADGRFELFALAGIGPWSVNTVAMLALGDPDAVAVGDYWLKHIISYALTGEPRGSDERMLELLEPWRGQRGRVCRLILGGGARVPRFGPRLPLRTIAAH